MNSTSRLSVLPPIGSSDGFDRLSVACIVLMVTVAGSLVLP